MSTTRTIAVTGASEQDAARISALLDKHRHRLSTPWASGDASAADLLVVDVESMYGQMDWLRARSSGRLVIAYTSASEPLEPEFSLRKPVVSGDLVALLNRIGEGLGSGRSEARAPMTPANSATYEQPTLRMVAAVAPANDAVEPAVEADVAPAPAAALASEKPAKSETWLLEELLTVLDASEGPVRLVHEGLPSIIVDAQHQRWYAAVSLKPLFGWSKLALRRDDLLHLDAAEFAQATGIMAAQPYARLVWLTRLARGEGELDAGLPADARYRLTRWPQVEREFPKHFRIATAMMSGTGTIDEIAAQSRAGVGDVVDFVNAYTALGYVECEAMLPVTSPGDRSGLLERVRKSLRN
ncbi:MAG: hypothetical protein ABW186_04375 [Rhodanobacteraceae bacterium]